MGWMINSCAVLFHIERLFLYYNAIKYYLCFANICSTRTLTIACDKLPNYNSIAHLKHTWNINTFYASKTHRAIKIRYITNIPMIPGISLLLGAHETCSDVLNPA